jgi:hypothetical protein
MNPMPAAGRRPASLLREWHRSVGSLLVLAGVTAVVSAIAWPGHLNLNGYGDYHDATSAHFVDWDSAIWSAIWHMLILAGLRSPGWMLAGLLMMQLAGLYLLLRVRFSRPPALAGAAAVLLFPPVLGFSILVGTGAWFAAPILAAFGSASRCARTRGASRVAGAIVVVVCGFLAQAARPTTAPAVLVLLGALAFVLIGPGVGGWRHAAAAAAGVVATALLFGSVAGVTRFVLHADATHPEQATYDYDLVALSVRENRVLFPRDIYPRQDVAYLARSANGDAGVLDITSLLWGSGHAFAYLDAGKVAELKRAWLVAIDEHPLDYLQTRLHSAVWQLGIAGPEFGVFSGAPPPQWFGPAPFPEASSALVAYTEVGTGAHDPDGGPLQLVWVYLVVLVAGAAVTIRGRRPGDVVLGLFAVALLLYGAEILVVSPGVTYRFMHPPVMAGTLLAVVLAVSIVTWLWSRVVRLASRPRQSPGTAGDSPASSR